MIYYLDLEIIRSKVHPDTVEYFTKKDDPIAPFSRVNMDMLESALAQCKWHYYPTIEKKSAILLYGMIKNHPFENGNKRVAIVTLITFLFVNGLEFDSFKVTNKDIADLALKVAESDRMKRDVIIIDVERWIKENTIYAEDSNTKV